MTSWHKLLKRAFDGDPEFNEPATGDFFHKIQTTLTDEEMTEEFYVGHGGVHSAVPFLAWSERFVYFSHCYDNRMSVCFVPRHPSDKPLDHIQG